MLIGKVPASHVWWHQRLYELIIIIYHVYIYIHIHVYYYPMITVSYEKTFLTPAAQRRPLRSQLQPLASAGDLWAAPSDPASHLERIDHRWGAQKWRDVHHHRSDLGFWRVCLDFNGFMGFLKILWDFDGSSFVHVSWILPLTLGFKIGFWWVLPSGHGWGVDEDNCAEFCDHSHHFSVNGVTTGLTKAHPTAGNQDGCKTKADPQMLSCLSTFRYSNTHKMDTAMYKMDIAIFDSVWWPDGKPIYFGVPLVPFWYGGRILVRQAPLTKVVPLIKSFYGGPIDHQQPLKRSTKGLFVSSNHLYPPVVVQRPVEDQSVSAIFHSSAPNYQKENMFAAVSWG